MGKFKVGDKVIIKSSPFASIKVNEICTIVSMSYGAFQCSNSLYTLSFFENEIMLAKSEILKEILSEEK